MTYISQLQISEIVLGFVIVSINFVIEEERRET